MEQEIKLLIINPGSTSTKISIFENGVERYKKSLSHPASEVARYARAADQAPFRQKAVEEFLAEIDYDLSGLTAIVARGGSLPPIHTGAYVVNGEMIDVLRNRPIGQHASTTAAIIALDMAKRLHIPIFHMEAGNRCKDECLPEETNRRIVDIISDVNMCYSEHARRYLAENGLPKERTYVTGSPMAEVLHANLKEIEASDIHRRLGLEKGRYLLLSAHREENIDTEKNFLSLFNAINALAEKYDMPILYSCHPRSKKRLEQSGFELDKRVIRHEPLGFHDYNCLQMNAAAVISDSGTLPEESSFFLSVGHPFPAVCIRTSTERPEALDKGDFILAGIDEKSLLPAVETAIGMNDAGNYGIPVPDYTDENVSTKVVKIIQSYTTVVNKMVWRKE